MEKKRVEEFVDGEFKDEPKPLDTTFDVCDRTLVFSNLMVSAGIEPSQWSITPCNISHIVKSISAVRNPAENHIVAGMTYLGQMITHELVPATTHSDNSRDVTPFFDLKSIYPERISDYRYFDDTGRFHLSCSRCDSTKTACKDCLKNDLNRDHDGRAIVPELRNDENIIVAQLHLQWLKLHNKMVSLVERIEPRASREKKILYARNYVTLIFQQVVKQDYLKAISDPLTYKYVITDDKDYLYPDALGKNYEIPREVSEAILRFGHSMIRMDYDLRQYGDNELITEFINDLMYTGSIREQHLIEWNNFFRLTPDDTPQFASKIKLNLANVLGYKSDNDKLQRRLERLRQKHFVPEPDIEKDGRKLVEIHKRLKGLIRKDIVGSINLPTGADILNAISIKESNRKSCGSSLYKDLQLPDIDCILTSLDEEVFSQVSQSKNGTPLKVGSAPLWLFVLAEADLFSTNFLERRKCTGANGHRLGPIASLTLLEVIKQSIEQSPTNIYQPFTVLANKLGPLAHHYSNIVSVDGGVSMGSILRELNSTN